MVQDNRASGDIAVGHIVAACWRWSPLVIAAALMVAALAAAVVRHLPPGYTAVSIAWVGERDSMIISSDSAWSTVNAQSIGNPEQGRIVASVLTSIPVMRRVVRELDLYERPDAVLSRKDVFLSSLRESLGFPAKTGSPMAGVAGDTVQFASRTPDREAHNVTDTSSGEHMTDAALATFDAMDAERSAAQELAIRGALASLLQNIDVDVDARSEIAVITYSGTDPELTAEVVNAVPMAYAAERRSRLQSGSDRAVAWLAARVEALQTDMVAAEQRRELFKVQNGLSDDVERSPDTFERLVTSVETAVTASAEAARRLQQARARVSSSDVDTELFQSSTLTQLIDLRAKSFRERRELSARVGPTHQLIIGLDRELDALDADIATEKARIVERLEEEVAHANAQVLAARQRLSDAQSGLTVAAAQNAETASELSELNRDVETKRALYTRMLTRLNDARQVAELDSDGISVIQSALPPTAPSSLNPLVFVAAAGFGTLLLGFGAVGGLTFIDRRIIHASQVRALGLETVVSAPKLPHQPRTSGRNRRARPKRGAAAARARLMFDEAVRRLFASTYCRAEQHGDTTRGHVIVVTSGSKREGKSAISAALARVAAASGTSTVLLEADLRRPGQFVDMVPRTNEGLTALLTGNQSLEETLIHGDDSSPDVVPTATTVPQSTELLASPRLKQLIETLRARYQLVVIDTPPACLTSDPEILAAYANDIVLVIKHRSSTIDRTESALEHIEKASASKITAFINMTDSRFMHEYYGSGAHLYEYTPFKQNRSRHFTRWWRTFGTSHSRRAARTPRSTPTHGHKHTDVSQ